MTKLRRSPFRFVFLAISASAPIFASAPNVAFGADAPSAPPSEYEKACASLASRSFGSADEKLNAIFDFQWKHSLAESPETATWLGVDEGQDRWSDMSLASLARRKREGACPAKLGASVARERLKTEAAKTSLDLFRYDAQMNLEGARFPEELLALTPVGGVHQDIPQTMANARHASVRDVENMLARLERAPELIRQNEDLLREGLKRGITAARETLGGIPAQFDPLLEPKMEKNPLYEPFAKLPESIAAADRARLSARARELIAGQVMPALARFRAFIVKEYVPGARTTIALADLPEGKAWYAYRAKQSTTTDLTPQQIHDIGLRETERIRGLMEKTMAEAGWKKDLPSFFAFLRTDKRFFFKKREDLLAGYRELGKRLDPELPALFGELPRLPWGVKEIPSYSEKTAPAAFYEPGSLDSGRAGYFDVNADAIGSRPKWEMEALEAHEAVPGHHLQIAIAQERKDLPNFRKHGSFTAYVEGWGLYAETLGYELGLYRDPYSKMGQLSAEMWRACRLVVDTGMHALGWSREKAVRFMTERMPKPEHDIRVEVDRYVSWPGQALAYKIGQMKITELRRRSKDALGDRFDVRAFHDAVLAEGALPLDVLEKRIDAWIAARKAQRTPAEAGN